MIIKEHKWKLLFAFYFVLRQIGTISCCSPDDPPKPTPAPGGDGGDGAATEVPGGDGGDGAVTEVPPGCEEGGSPGKHTDADMPKFVWTHLDTDKSPGPFHLQVTFADNYIDESILFERGDKKILKGVLNKEKDVEVSVVGGKPGDTSFNIAMKSSHHEGGLFEVQNGVTYEIVADNCTTDGEVKSDGGTHAQNQAQTNNGPPSEFVARLWIGYDNPFLQNVASGDNAKAKQTIRSIINLAEPVFTNKQQWKLNSRIHLDEVEINHVSDTLTLNWGPGQTLNRISQTNNGRAEANLYHYFTYDTDRWGVGGIAYKPGICQGRQVASAITEWHSNSDFHLAMDQCMLIFAHEIGHNLNMPHDFIGRNTNNCQKDSGGNSCCANKNTIMDYADSAHVSKWSSCSNEHMGYMGDGTQENGQNDWSCVSRGGATPGMPGVTSRPGVTSGGSSCSCIDAPWARNYCTQREVYGGCNGINKSWFDEYCPNSCCLDNNGSC